MSMHVAAGSLALLLSATLAAGQASKAPTAAKNAPSGKADLPALFGSRVKASSVPDSPTYTGDFDGDGIADTIYLVAVAPAAAQNKIAADVTVANPWDEEKAKGPIAAAGEPLALAITHGKGGRKFLIHSADFFGTPLWQEGSAGYLEVIKKGSKTFHEFQRQNKNIKHDFLILESESGVHLALYWNGSSYAIVWSDEEP